MHDFLNPDRIVVGCDAADAAERVAALYARLGAPTVLTDARQRRDDQVRGELLPGDEAVLRQRARRAVRAAGRRHRATSPRASATTAGSARRSSRPGPGWGGSCLPKDTHALLQVADAADFEFRLLRATIDTNTRQHQRIVDKIRTAVTGRRNGSLSKRRLALFGLTFKAGTDDLRGLPVARGRRAAAAGRGRAGRLRPGAVRRQHGGRAGPADRGRRAARWRSRARTRW